MEQIIRSGLLVCAGDVSLSCPDQVDYLFREWTEQLPAALTVKDSIEYTFWTINAEVFWKSINQTRKDWWENSKPTSTFLELKTRPDGRPWGNAVVAMEAAAVIGDQLKKRESFYLDGVVKRPNYCHAKLLHFPDRDELFFSGVVALTEIIQHKLQILEPENLTGQVDVCIQKIKELCQKAGMQASTITMLEIFLPKWHYPFAGTIVEKLYRAFGTPQITYRRVDGLFMPGLLVEIRPHAVAWK